MGQVQHFCFSKFIKFLEQATSPLLACALEILGNKFKGPYGTLSGKSPDTLRNKSRLDALKDKRRALVDQVQSIYQKSSDAL